MTSRIAGTAVASVAVKFDLAAEAVTEGVDDDEFGNDVHELEPELL